jgi:hypothetical protein
MVHHPDIPVGCPSETADIKLKEWLNLVERTLLTRVCFVAGKERKPNSYGMEVPWHSRSMLFLIAVCAPSPPPGKLHR